LLPKTPKPRINKKAMQVKTSKQTRDGQPD